MFASAPEFSSFSVRDIEEARRFYGDTLGLPSHLGEDGIMPANAWGGPANAWIKDPSGNWISIFEDPSA